MYILYDVELGINRKIIVKYMHNSLVTHTNVPNMYCYAFKNARRQGQVEQSVSDLIVLFVFHQFIVQRFKSFL